jgi:YggT family protein
MHALGYLILAIARLLGLVINIYTFVIAAAVLISWVNADPFNPVVKVIRSLTEPVFDLFRKVVPNRLYRTGFDFTPVVVLLFLILFDTIIVNLLFDLGRGLLLK